MSITLILYRLYIAVILMETPSESMKDLWSRLVALEHERIVNVPHMLWHRACCGTNMDKILEMIILVSFIFLIQGIYKGFVFLLKFLEFEDDK